LIYLEGLGGGDDGWGLDFVIDNFRIDSLDINVDLDLIEYFSVR